MLATSSTPARRIDLGAVIALTWLGVALGVTLIFGPSLGLRGWAWLGLQHLLAVIGAPLELWRAQRRAAGSTKR